MPSCRPTPIRCSAGAVRHWPAPAGRCGFGVLALVTAIANLDAGPTIVGLTAPGRQPDRVEVYAGARADFELSLVAAETLRPQLRANLAAVNGTVAAAAGADLALETHPLGSSTTGSQRFALSFEVPPVERRQKFLLQVRMQTAPGAEWQPLPAVFLEAVPSAWKESLGRFCGRFKVGLVAYGKRLPAVLSAAGVDLAETNPDALATAEGIQVWFAEPCDDAGPLAPARGAVVILFKPGAGRGIAVARTATAFNVVVDASVLADLGTDPGAQETLERALAAAATMLPDHPLQP